MTSEMHRNPQIPSNGMTLRGSGPVPSDPRIDAAFMQSTGYAPPTSSHPAANPTTLNSTLSNPGGPTLPTPSTPSSVGLASSVMGAGVGGGVSVVSSSMGCKPAVGTPEWHKQRRENHKEVERRRREAINTGIIELARVVPGCDKAKGSILTRAVQYIQELREQEHSNMEKWTLEKLLLEQAIDELTRELTGVRGELERVKDERDMWRERAETLEKQSTGAISISEVNERKRLRSDK